MTRSAHWFLLVLMIAGLGLLVMSCSDDDDGPTNPDGDTGIVIVVTRTDNPDVPGTWSLDGPGGTQTGSGTATLEDLDAGDYTVSWNDIEGWITPDPRDGTLGGGRTLTLSGTYEFIPPPIELDITIDPNPNDLNASWVLHLPDESVQGGQGDDVLEDLGAGDYMLVWGDVVGYVTPDTLWGEELEEDFTFSATYEPEPDPFGDFVTVVAGTFTMGDAEGDADELPVRTVTLTNDFSISETEITNIQFANLMFWALGEGHATLDGDLLLDNLDGSTDVLYDFGEDGVEITLVDGSYTTTCSACPVTFVSWKAAAAYCDWLSLQEGLTRAYDHADWTCNGGAPYDATGYRLPTEAEWEYACRGGLDTDFGNGDMPANYVPCSTSSPLNDIGWYCGNAPERSQPVQRLEANDFLLYDMHGNAWEWCNDWYADSYDAGETIDPEGPASGDGEHVIRGGSWYSEQIDCRSANRYPYPSPVFTSFRPVRTLD